MKSFNKYRLEAFSEHYQTSKIKLFAKMVKDFQPLTIFTKRCILNVWHGPKCSSQRFSEQIFPNACVF